MLYVFEFIFEDSGSGICSGLSFVTKCKETERVCEAAFTTNGQTCKTHCQGLGLICENGWNEKVSGGCTKDLNDRTGCDVNLFGQICRCKTST